MNKFLLIFFILTISLVFGQNYYMGDNKTSCICHEVFGTISGWQETKHSFAQDSLAFLQYSCLQCHNTGWDTLVVNYGADEYVAEDAGAPFGWIVTDSINWNKVKNIQCENCHGPLGKEDRTQVDDHPSVAVVNFSADLCGGCHQGSHHPTWTDWQQSKHAFSKETTIPGGNFAFIKHDPNCSGCHTPEGFLQYLEQEELEPDVDPPGEDGHDITCATCHDPHSHEHEAQLRLDKTELCAKCHNPEYNPDNPEPTGEELHHTTAWMFEAIGGYEYEGYNYESSTHKFAVVEKCVTCHVFMTEFVEEPEEVPAYTGHTFEPQPGACEGCHQDFAEFWAEDSSFDYRGVQSEIDSLANMLETKLEMASSADSTTDAFKRAKFNLDFVHGEGSHGIHNTKYARGLLQSAIDNFEPTAIEQVEIAAGVPLKYALDQNYPNPFNPLTEIEFSIKKAGDVSLKVYDLLGKEVMTLVDGNMAAGTYKARFDGAGMASGIYIYRIVAGEYTAMKKMVLVK